MLCVTGNENNLDALVTRLERVRQRGILHKIELIQEVRLDALELSWADPGTCGRLTAALAHYGPELIICARPSRQGGCFKGDETARLALLFALSRQGFARYIDIEADVDPLTVRHIAEASATKIIISWHDFKGIPHDLQERLTTMAQHNAALLKIAVMVDDAVDLVPLLEIHRHIDQPLIVIAMGLAGTLSRCRYRAFGSPWTYVSADENAPTAPGQLTLEQAEAIGLPTSATKPFFALVGGTQIAYSRGMTVYNRLFRARAKPWSYLAVVSECGEPTFEMLRRLGAKGVSVTMPLKALALDYATGGCDELSLALGAVNSLRFVEAHVEATNTDVIGVIYPLRRWLTTATLSREPPSILVLGGGGAARAAVHASRQLGAKTYVAARNPVQSAELADLGAEAIDWTQRAELSADILINATPVAGAKNSPWPPGRALEKKLVFDLAINHERSKLIADALSEGAQIIEAEAMWFEQGAAQIRWMSDEPCAAEELRMLGSEPTREPLGR